MLLVAYVEHAVVYLVAASLIVNKAASTTHDGVKGKDSYIGITLIMAKVLANRLQEVIDELARPFQSAFILERQLVDIEVVVGKIVAAWGRKGT